MSGEEHMKFTWAFELVGPRAVNTLIAALQESAIEKDNKLVVMESELRDTFARLYGYSKDIVEHFNEPIRFLRKSGIIFVERPMESAEKVISARAGVTEFCVNKDILNVDSRDMEDVFKYVARKAYDFHIPFKLLIDIVNKDTVLTDKEVLRKMLSEKMLEWAEEKRPQYYEKKKREMQKRGKTIDNWKYPLAHFNAFLAIAEKVGLISQKGRYVERIVEARERRISYNEFKDFLLEEYSKFTKEQPNLLMVSVDDLRNLITRKLEISEETFEKMMRSFVLRNMGKITIYRQKTKGEEKGLKMPDNVTVFAIVIKGEQLV
jgi:hypothetical protein